MEEKVFILGFSIKKRKKIFFSEKNSGSDIFSKLLFRDLEYFSKINFFSARHMVVNILKRRENLKNKQI